MFRKSGDAEFWMYPPGVSCGTNTSKSRVNVKYIKEVQAALNEYYDDHPNYPLTVDGIWGPKTCGAMYKLQNEFVGVDNIQLLSKTFEAIYLPGSYSEHFKNSCKAWYKSAGVIEATPTPEEPPIMDAMPDSPPMDIPWLWIFVGAGAGTVSSLGAQKAKWVRPSKMATAGGALGGALIGFVAGKLGG